MANSGYYPAPGAQNAGAYPKVGPNYLKYGEQPGWVYSPRDDKYYRNQQYRDDLKKYEENAGLRDKPASQPGLGSVLLPIGATALTVAAAQQLAQNGFHIDAIGNVFDKAGKFITRLTTPTATTAPSVPSTPTTTGSASSSGLLGASNSAPAPTVTPTPT